MVKTQGHDLETQEDHGVIISLITQQCVMEGRAPRDPLQGGEGDRRRTCSEGFTPVALKAHDSQCGFQLLTESLQVVFTGSIL